MILFFAGIVAGVVVGLICSLLALAMMWRDDEPPEFTFEVEPELEMSEIERHRAKHLAARGGSNGTDRTGIRGGGD
jgi:hypothetical protein